MARGRERTYPCRDVLNRLMEYGFEIDPAGAPGSHARIYHKDNPERRFSFYCADEHDKVPERWIKNFARWAGMDWREIVESETDHKRRKKTGKLSRPCP